MVKKIINYIRKRRIEQLANKIRKLKQTTGYLGTGLDDVQLGYEKQD